MKRFIITVSLAFALIASPVSANIGTSPYQSWSIAKCFYIGQRLNYQGLTEREREFLVRMDCQQLRDGSWTTALLFSQ